MRFDARRVADAVPFAVIALLVLSMLLSCLKPPKFQLQLIDVDVVQYAKPYNPTKIVVLST